MWLAILACGSLLALAPHTQPIGIFEDHSDVGTVLHPGTASFDAASQTYTVAGCGENMWLKADAFHFVWKKVSGDVSLAADIAFLGSGKNPHRKACLLVRQSLDADSAYADVALHGVGLTSLQFRDEKGETTREVQSNVDGPKRVRIEKLGDYVTISVTGADGKLAPSGGSAKVPLQGSFYVGLGVCSHEKDVTETATFSNVELKALVPGPTKLQSTLEVVDVGSADRKTVHMFDSHIEAPNWTSDGKWLIYNSGGRLYKIPAKGGTPDVIDTGFADRCNNDHGLSPDGKTIVISDQSQDPHQSIIYTLPLEGGTPKRITDHFPSYWHGWSPDGKTLAYCAQRDGKFGIFTIPAEGGAETRLTATDGLDDGPEYSPDGNYIYFNSDRSGRMQIWRMRPDGSDLEQVTNDEFNNWFPHFSPDGKRMVILSYEKSVKGHPPNKDVQLRLVSVADGSVSILAKLFGGQGTINVPSWAPDGKSLAFVSYQLVRKSL